MLRIALVAVLALGVSGAVFAETKPAEPAAAAPKAEVVKKELKVKKADDGTTKTHKARKADDGTTKTHKVKKDKKAVEAPAPKA